MVDFSKFKEMKTGVKAKTKVKEILEGKMEDFKDDAYFDAMENVSKDEKKAAKEAAAINVIAENGASIQIRLPKGGNMEVHPKSTLASWKRTYKEYPAVGQEINTETDQSGFGKIVLEK